MGSCGAKTSRNSTKKLQNTKNKEQKNESVNNRNILYTNAQENYDKEQNFIDMIQKEFEDSTTQINQLTDQLKKNQQRINCFTNQKIVIIIGITAIGKSTYMNYLNNVVFKKVSNRYVIENGEETFQIGRQYESTTREINFLEYEKLFICDTPGLKDSKGNIQDILNVYLIHQAIKEAVQTKFVLFITSELFIETGAGEGFKQTIRQFSKYLTQKPLTKFLLVINKIKIEEKLDKYHQDEQLKEQIEFIQIGILKMKEGFQDDFEKQIVQIIQKKMEKRNFLIFYPNRSEERLEHLKQMQKLKGVTNQNYKKEINQLLSKDSQVYLQSIFNDCIQQIQLFLKQNKYEQIIQIFSDLKSTSDFIKNQIIEEKLKQLQDSLLIQGSNMQEFKNQMQYFVQEEINENSQSLINSIITQLNFQIFLTKILQICKTNSVNYTTQLEQFLNLVDQYLNSIYQDIIKSNKAVHMFLQLDKLKQIYENNELKRILVEIEKNFNIEIAVLQKLYYQQGQKQIEQKQKQYHYQISNIIQQKNYNKINVLDMDRQLDFLKYCSEQNKNQYNHLSDSQYSYQSILNFFQEAIVNYQQDYCSIQIQDADHSHEEFQRYFMKLPIFKEESLQHYQFIKFIYTNIHLGRHFQNNEIQKKYQNIRDYQKKILESHYNHIQNLKEFDQIKSLINKILIFKKLDKSIFEDLIEENCYKLFSNELDQFQHNQTNLYLSILQEIFEKIQTIINDQKYEYAIEKDLQLVSQITQQLSIIKQIDGWRSLFSSSDKLLNKSEKIKILPQFQESSSLNDINDLSTESTFKFIDWETNYGSSILYQPKQSCEEYENLYLKKCEELFKQVNKNNENNEDYVQDKIFKTIQFLFKIITANSNQFILFMKLENQFFTYLENILLQEFNYDKTTIIFNQQQIHNLDKVILKLIQQKQIFQNLQNHLEQQIIDYFSNINSFSNKKIKKDFDIESLGNIQKNIDDLQEQLNKLQKNIEQEIKQTLFKSKELAPISSFKPEDLKYSFEQLKLLFNDNNQGINKLFKESLYKKYQLQLQEQIGKLIDETFNKVKQNHANAEIVDVFQEQRKNLNKYVEILRDYFLEDNDLEIERLDEEFTQSIENYKKKLQLLTLLNQYEKISQIYIQQNLKQELKEYIEIQIKQSIYQIQDQIDDQIQKIINSPSNQYFDDFLRLVKLHKTCIYYFQNLFIDSEEKKLEGKILSFLKDIIEKVFVDIWSLNKNQSMYNVLKHFTLNLEFTYVSKENLQYFIQKQINLTFQEIEKMLITCQQKDNYKGIGSIKIIRDLVLELQLNNINFDTKNIKEQLQLIIPNLIFRHVHSQFYINKQETKKNIERINQILKEEFEFLEYNKQQISDEISLSFNKLLEFLDEVDQILNNSKFEKINSIFISYQSNLIEQKLLQFIVEVENDIFTKLFPFNNFQDVNNKINNLSQMMEQPFLNNNDKLKNSINNIYKKFKSQVSEYLVFIRNGLKYPEEISKQLNIINKLIKIKNYGVAIIQDQYSEKDISDIMQVNINQMHQLIEESVLNLSTEETIKYYKEMEVILNQTVNIQNQYLNYFQVYLYIIRTNNLNEEQNKINIAEQFNLPINKLFLNFVDHLQSNLTNLILDQIQNNQFDKIVEQHNILIKYCRNMEPFFRIKDQTFIIKQVESYYEQQINDMRDTLNNIQFEQIGALIAKEKFFKDIEIQLSLFSSQIKQKQHSTIINNKYVSIINNITNKFNPLIQNIQVDQNVIQFTQELISLYQKSQEFECPYLQDQCTVLIGRAIKNQELKVIECLIKNFNSNPIGALIVQNNDKLFYEWNIEMYNKQTKGQNNIDYCKKNIKIMNLGKIDAQYQSDKLEEQFKKYQEQISQIDKLIILNQLNLQMITDMVKEKVDQFKNTSNYLKEYEIQWSTDQKNILIEILAYISSAWSIIDNQNQNKTKRFLHIMQVVIIMRLLNIDIQETSKVQNHIAQIKTGEGKSITLGITSTILALLGFNIDCCCYSQYLSERDFQSFKPFFVNFNVEKQIQFNTFGKLMEQYINSPYSLRQLGESYINRSNTILKEENNTFTDQKRVLLIDEIDFFFGESFLGQVYSIACQYTCAEVVKIFKLIWKKRYRGISLQNIQEMEEYKSLFNNHPDIQHLQEIIDIKIQQMIEDSKQMENHTYVLNYADNHFEKVIGYKILDSIRYDIVKRYKTSFSYLAEWQRQNINDYQLRKKLSLNFNLGCFSYSEIFNQYSLILGVSGTLEYMTEPQKKQMQDLKIQLQTISPSLFGESKLKFDVNNDIHIETTKQSYFDKISKQIKDEIDKNRPVLVFFENQHILHEFKQQHKPLCQIQILNEQAVDKNYIIIKAGYPKMLTLTTKSFGRGTDFKIYDEVEKIGGIHAIQTFLSETKTEEQQILGRVARNGSSGSYSLIVLQSSLESVYGFKGQMNNQKISEVLSTLRNNKLKEKDQKQKQDLKQANDIDIKSQKLKKFLKEYYDNKDEKYIHQINKLFKEISHFGDSKDNVISQNEMNKFDLEELKKAPKDKFNNPVGEQFDLGKDGSCKQYKLLIGEFCTAADCDLSSDLEKEVKSAINKKGFKDYKIVDDEEQFINLIDEYDQVWVISGEYFKNNKSQLQKEFVDKIQKHLEKRKGLMLWCDNDPFFYHANLIMNVIPIGYEEQQPIYMYFEGNDRANNKLLQGQFNKKLEFGFHLIVKGLLEIYEGNTICYPKLYNNKLKDSYDDFNDLEIIGTSKTNKPCMFVLNATNDRGRIVFDCGFTKLCSNNWAKTAGTERYVQNCYCWLNFLDEQIN